jgi:hypothetical protein
MHVEQRRLTLIDLHDGKARSFVLQREAPGWKLSAVSKDDVLHLMCSAHDLQRLRDEVMRPELAPHWKSQTENWTMPTSEYDPAARGLVRVDHSQVTTVVLPLGQVNGCALQSDSRGFHLTCLTPKEAVHIHLPAHDLYRLREVLRPEPTLKEYHAPASTKELVHAPREQAPFRWTATEWLAYN